MVVESILKDQSVLVSGATGFIGSWLVEKLVAQGSNVTAFVRPNSPRRNVMRWLPIEPNNIVYGDVKNAKDVARAVKSCGLIFHLAAITQVKHSLENPLETFSVNLQGTLNILEAMRKSDKGQKLVYASTDKVYGEPIKLPIDEQHPLFGKSPYDASKIAADRAVYSYYKTYGLPVVIARLSNVYGGRDLNFLRAIPDFVSSAILGEKMLVRGSGKHIRDFMFVGDAVSAFLKLAVNMSSNLGEAFNFGTGKPTTVFELARQISACTGAFYKVLYEETPAEIDKQVLDSKKAKEKLNWKAGIELKDGLQHTVDWYSSNKDLWKPYCGRELR